MAQTEKEHRYISVKEAARLLSVHRYTIHRFIDAGFIRAIKYGIKTSPLKLDRHDVLELLKNGNTNGKAAVG